MTKLIHTSFILLLILVSCLMCQSNLPTQKVLAAAFIQDSIYQPALIADLILDDYRKKEKIWVDAQMKKLNQEEKLGQLFMIGAYPQNGSSDEKKVLADIEKHHVGGLIFFRGNESRIAQLTNKYQSKSKKIPLMMSMDAEWGTNMRVRNAIKYPRQLMMGAIQNNALIYEFGAAVANECKAMGIHINFAPVVDVNNNPANPVIGDRSFGENRENVTAKAFQYISGLQDNGVMACAKHFPGHGDTDVDSHKDLPIIRHNMARLDSIEMYPFRNLAQQGVQSMMVAHLHIPAIDSTPNLPITLSKPAVTGILKEKLGYKGLIFTDALNMRGVTKHFADGETDLRAFLAGNDVLLVTQDIPNAKKKIKAAIKAGKTSWKEVDRRVRKILRAKYKLGLSNYKAVPTKNIYNKLVTPQTKALKRDIVASAITLANDPMNLVPVNVTDNIACISVNTSKGETAFQKELKKYGIKSFYTANKRVLNSRLNILKRKKTVIVAIHNIGRSIKNDFDIPASIQRFVQELSSSTKVIVVPFGTPYSLKFFDRAQSAVVGYNNEELTQKLVAQALCGVISFQGKLPISASSKYKYGMGKFTTPNRLPYALPEAVGMNTNKLTKINQIAAEMIRTKAAPGCQVLIAKDGKIIFHKAYGHHTYRRKRKVQLDDVYDLASVTKVAATTISLMKLYEQGKLDINKPIGYYLTELKGSNKENLLIKDILAHQAGLRPWIPFYTKTLDDDKKPLYGKYYSKKKTKTHQVAVADQLYFAQAETDSVIWQRIKDQSLRSSKNYRYSDLGFILFTKLVKKLSGKTLDEFVADEFYRPMGLGMITFNPLQHGISKYRIVPTEQDDYFRYQTVQGYVHDMASAMLGGVAGHAGLFATPTDLASVYQMLANGGEFAGKRYLRKSTIDKFSAKYARNSRRGLGFDRKDVRDGKTKSSVNVAWQASSKTFGHLGFTGIGAWADPENRLVYLFLSNRTYPDMENMGLIRKDIRTRMHEVAYEAAGID